MLKEDSNVSLACSQLWEVPAACFHLEQHSLNLCFVQPCCAAPLGIGLGGRLPGDAATAEQPAGGGHTASGQASASSAGAAPPAAASGGVVSGHATADDASAHRTAAHLHGPDAFSARAAAAAGSTEPAPEAAAAHPGQQDIGHGITAAPDALGDAHASLELHSASAGGTDAVQQASGQPAAATPSGEPQPQPGRLPAVEQPPRHYWGQALQHLDRQVWRLNVETSPACAAKWTHDLSMCHACLHAQARGPGCETHA